jgi:hypothetical protein
VIDELAVCRADAVGLERLRAVLGSGPWCWPPDGDTRRIQWATDVLGHGLRECEPGRSLAVTVQRQAATLWCLTAPVSGSQSAEGPRFAEETAGSWRTAAAALPRSVPVLWAPLNRAHHARPVLTRLATFVKSGVEPRAVVIDGPSFGLTFLIHLASRVFGEPIPWNIAATAALDDAGRVTTVEGLDLKCAALVKLAPRIQRLLVCAAQADEARTAVESVGGAIEVVPVSTASQALDVVFGNRLAELLVSAGNDDARVRELTDAFFRLALIGRGGAVDWSPVRRAAELARSAWVGRLGADDAYTLAFVAAVAARHEENAGSLVAPPNTWLDSRPLATRLMVVTHLVQHCSDAGSPPVAEVERLATPYLAKSVREAFVGQLRLAGARARLRAVTGRPLEALTEQEQIATTLFDALRYEDVSYNLSEWFRLAGACSDADAWRRAEALRAELETVGGLGLEGSPYIDLARAKGAVMLGFGAALDVQRCLEGLSGNLALPGHVRWSAARWLVRLYRSLGEGRRTEVLLGQLRDTAQCGEEQRTHASIPYRLAQIDEALAAGQCHGVRVVLDELLALEPGVVGHLLRAVGPEVGESAVADYVSRFYPY